MRKFTCFLGNCTKELASKNPNQIFHRLSLLLCLVVILNLPNWVSGQTEIDPVDIQEFARLLEEQPEARSIDVDDLSDRTISIIWVYPDRRAARSLMNRLASYLNDQRVHIRYYWEWPDRIPADENEIRIAVYGKEDVVPEWAKGWYGIRIGTSEDTGISELRIPEPTKANLDLAGQFLMNGIELNESGEIRTGNRVSYLPAEYWGLDGEFITNQLDSILQMGLDSAAYPGAVVSVAYKGSVIYEKAVGYHTFDQVYRERIDDLFDLASVTKVTAGVNALMTLYEAGLFDPEKNLSDYFSYFENTDKGDLSLRRILTHSAGLMPYMVYYSMAQKDNGEYEDHTISTSRHGEFNYAITDSLFASDQFNRFVYRAIKESPLKTGNAYEHSGLFFLLIPDLVRQQTGQTLDDYLAEKLFRPIGSVNTDFNPAWNYNIHQIIPTEVDQTWRHQLVHGGVHDEAAAVLGGISANAGLFSTGPDLIKIGETWRRNGQYGGRQYWTPETIATFTHCIFCDEGNRRSLGFDRQLLPTQDYVSYMSPLASQESYGHSGFTGTMIWVDPEVEYTFVFLSNRVHPTRENSKLYSLNIRPDLHSVLYRAIQRSQKR